MPRNSSGTYTLVAGNPVIANTLIETGWANPTMGDIAQALSDSLDRYGRGSMLAPLKFADGTVAAPGISFGSESSTGFYRPSAGTLATSVTGIEVMECKPDGITTLFPLRVKIGGTNIVSIDATEVTSSVPVSSPSPVDADHLTNKGYVDAYVDGKFTGAAGGGYLPLAGGELSGNITVKHANWPQFHLTNTGNAVDKTRGYIALANTSGELVISAINDANTIAQSGLRIARDGKLYDAVSGGRLLNVTDYGPGNGINADMTDGYHVNEGPVASTIVARDASKNIQANLLYGGAGSAGTLYTHGGGGSVNFRWDGTNLFYRVNEAVDRLISTTATFAWSQADPGYLQVGPVIIQWGSTSCNIDSSVIVNLPKAWSYCVNAQATTFINANLTGTSVVSANVLWVSATQIAVGIGDQSWSGSVPIKWIAIGW